MCGAVLCWRCDANALTTDAVHASASVHRRGSSHSRYAFFVTTFTLLSFSAGISRGEYAERRTRFGELLCEAVTEHAQLFDEKSHMLALIPAPFWYALIENTNESFHFCRQYVGPHVPYEFRQSSHFLYLSGVLEPGAMLCAWRLGGGDMRFVVRFLSHNETILSCSFTLFVAPRDVKSELWDGPKLGAEDAAKFTGLTTTVNSSCKVPQASTR